MSAPLDTRLRAETLRGTKRPLPSGIAFRLTAIPSAPFRSFWSAYWSNVAQHTCSCLESRYPRTFGGVRQNECSDLLIFNHERKKRKIRKGDGGLSSSNLADGYTG